MTSFDVTMLATPNIDYYAQATAANWADYCARHGYTFIRWQEKTLPQMHIVWSQIDLMIRHMKASKADWIVTTDADTIVNKMDQPLTELLDTYDHKTMIISEDCSRRFGLPVPLSLRSIKCSGAWRAPNTGFFMLRNDARALEMLEKWMDYATGDYAAWNDIHPRQQRIFWWTIFKEYRPHIAVIKSEVMRIGTNALLDRWMTDWSNAFIHHDKRLPLKDH